jgi:hypothetical protein
MNQAKKQEIADRLFPFLHPRERMFLKTAGLAEYAPYVTCQA